MITTGEMQVSGMLAMTILAMMLAVRVPPRAMRHAGFARARWLLVGGTLLIALQFFVQHQMGLRQMGVTQAVFLNLLLFMPAALFINMAILNVQRRGRVSLKEWTVGVVACGIVAVGLVATVLFDGVPLPVESPSLRSVEYVGAALYMLMQCHYYYLQVREYKRLQLAVDEYFDHERHDLLRWMGLSVHLLTVMALLVPLGIFFEGAALVVFSIVTFFSISYTVISIYSYGISEDASRVEEAEEAPPSAPKGATIAPPTCKTIVAYSGAEEGASDTVTMLTDDERQQVEKALKQWTAEGAFRQHNLTLGIVAKQIHVSLRLLQLWLRQSEYHKLATLMNHLRVEDAKQVLGEHPDWSTESVADYCGFSSRQYFHQIFVQHTGTTPAKFQKNN